MASYVACLYIVNPTECSGPPHLLGPVGFGRAGGGASGLLMTLLPNGHLGPHENSSLLDPGAAGTTRACQPRALSRRVRGLFDFAFAEFHVLFGDRIVFFLHQLVSHGARILAGDVVEGRIRAG